MRQKTRAHKLMQGLSMTRNIFLAALALVILGAAPAFAKSSVSSTPAPKGDNATEAVGDSAAAPDPASAMATASASSDSLANFGPSSGTVVGNRALELRDEMLRLRASVNLNSNEFAVLRSTGAAGSVQYHSTVAAITARLQNGTTRGNPILLRQWDEANQSLEQVTTSLGHLNSLQTAIDADASMASYLLESVQAAFQLSGAVDEDHDQLKLLRDECSRLVVQLDYLRNQTANDIQRQTAYLTGERSNLQSLAFAISRGELLGNSLANRAVVVNPMPVLSVPEPIANSSMPAPMAPPTAMAPPPAMVDNMSMTTATPAAAFAPGSTSGPEPMSPRQFMEESGQAPITPSSATAGSMAPMDAPSVGHLLVLIRYNQPNVQYEQQLSQAVGTAMERRPDAQFSVVAVSPASGDPADLAQQQASAERDAEAVKRSLVQLGLSPSRISMATTQMQAAQTAEVHVYIR